MYSSTVTQFEEPPQKKDIDDAACESSTVPYQEAEQPLIWRNILGIAALHIIAVYSFITRSHEAHLYTWIWSLVYGLSAGLGITAGAHRLWAHRSYSAKLPLKLFLTMLYCMGGQTCPYNWIRDHRTHHRYTETQADPHDANRGFFFSHVGWLMMRRHPSVKKYGNKVDMSDILEDPVLKFTNKYYTPIMLFFCFILPTVIPVYAWGEAWDISILAGVIRYVWELNATFSVNSFAHMWGNRPYNSHLKPTENAVVSFMALGEGWHNYHHSFPWDYKAAELGAYGLNASTGFIELMARLGLAYNLKTPSKEVIEKISINKGDGTNSYWGNQYHHNDKGKQAMRSR